MPKKRAIRQRSWQIVNVLMIKFLLSRNSNRLATGFVGHFQTATDTVWSRDQYVPVTAWVDATVYGQHAVDMKRSTMRRVSLCRFPIDRMRRDPQ